MKLCDLKKPFPANDIEWRVQRSGDKNGKPWAMVLAYVTARAIMDRLDEVCGPENWKNCFKDGPNGGLLCGISIKTGEEWVTKWDGADNTQVEAVKGGLSGAMKRAGVQWGIGRYLYKLEATWAVVCKNGAHSDKLKNGTWFKWNPPELPAWALPDNAPPAEPKQSGKTERPRQAENPELKPPEQSQLDRFDELCMKKGMAPDKADELFGYIEKRAKKKNGAFTTIEMASALEHFERFYADFMVDQIA